MRIFLLSIFTLIQYHVKGNMSSPVKSGTLGSSPFTNQYVHIREENIFITIDNKFETAQFDIEYHIDSEKNGIKIPLLFYASQLNNSFNVTIDGKPIELKDIPYELNNSHIDKFKDFSYFFDPKYDKTNPTIWIEESSTTSFGISIHDFRYFETDITAGKHIIKISYLASIWSDGSNWINEYSFKYALSPAKYWKSYGTLNLTIDATAWGKPISCNVGKPSFGSIDSIAHWSFKGLPTDILTITYNPEINIAAKILVLIKPLGLALIFLLILIIVHFKLIKAYRKKNINKKFSKVVIFGSIIIPLFFFISWILFYHVIDVIIGKHASTEHGYYFAVIILYPIVLPFYWISMWLTDRTVKRNETKEIQNQATGK
jgi:hypothetical protein